MSDTPNAAAAAEPDAPMLSCSVSCLSPARKTRAGTGQAARAILVRAEFSADARLVASEAELDFTEIDAKPAEGTDTRMASAFRDEKLYTVIEVETGAAAEAGPRGVVEGTVSVGTIRPTEFDGCNLGSIKRRSNHYGSGGADV